MNREEKKQRLTAAIRAWTHFDNLVESLNQQATNNRRLREEQEAETIPLLKDLGLSKTKFQITGATLQLATQRNTEHLTWGYLEKEIPAWIASQRLPPAYAESLMEWLQSHREVKETEYIKKTKTQAPHSQDPQTQNPQIHDLKPHSHK